MEMFFEGPEVLNWGSFLVLALPLGAFAAAWRVGELRWQIPNLSSMARMFAAGLAIGLSANIAGGVQHWVWLHRCTNLGVEQPDGNNIYFLTRLAGKLLALYPRPAHPTIQDQNQPLIQPGPGSPDQ